MKISIIIITYNRPDDALDLLMDIAALDNLRFLQDVVLVNNNSSADYSSVTSFIQANSHVPWNYINSPENFGVSRGRNYATSLAQGDILLYIDDDVNIKDKNALVKVIEAFNSQPQEGRKLGVVSFKVLYSYNMQMQQNALPHKKYGSHKDLHNFNTYYYAGCAHAKLKDAWVAAGPYPENFFYGMEEYDFSFRVLGKNFYIRYDDSLTILHKESPLGRRTKEEKLRMMWVNKSKVAWRYLPAIYFYSTATMWAFHFLVKSKFKIRGFVKGLKEIAGIPGTEKRTIISPDTKRYLKSVDARLWF